MSNPYVAEIRIFPFNFAPLGWAFCNGQILPISQNTALFSLVGTFYGGDGESNFALPNFQGAVPVGMGQGAGLSLYSIGQSGGSDEVTLIQSEMPSHQHAISAANVTGYLSSPAGNIWANSGKGRSPAYHTADSSASMSPQCLSPVGSSFPHNNMQPYLTLNFCIALQGVYPPRP